MMKDFNTAIKSNEVKAFMLGRGQYFVRSLDWGGHDSTSTYAEILSYLMQNNEQKGFRIIEEALIDILKTEFFSVDDLSKLIGVIWSYYVNRKAGKIKSDWNISEELKELFLLQIAKHRELNSEMGNINWTLQALYERFNFSFDKI